MLKRITDDQVFEGRIIFQIPPNANNAIFKSIDTTPNINNVVVCKCSGTTITITNFIGGNDNYTIRVLGDGTTTIKNNVTIVTNTGADKLLLLNKMYRFTYFVNVWYEDA